ncbi:MULTISPECIES: cytochrome-c peroxidase [Methylomicrobium]|uniref:cytochrome-c peroxidase n=1 Tax=Methylomicrobium TaxID=39773 RepID=UPI001FE16097|nr:MULTISPECIES: cytochrome c peroxidase [Methylomicrobium]
MAEPTRGLPPLSIPADNPQSADKIALGKRLFNDPRLSADGSIACANCHVSGKAFTDGRVAARGIKGQIGTRNAPSILNAAYYQTLFLDGRAASLEEQVLGPLFNPIEHGLANSQALIEVIRSDAEYTRLFKTAFTLTADAVTAGHVAQAIAAYERTLIAGDSPFDRFLFGRDRAALSPSAARGLRIFQRKGNCMVCHEISWDHALFTDNRFYNLGVGSQILKPVLSKFLKAKKPDRYPLTDAQRSELGLFNVTKDPADIGKFKTPILRNVALTGPYMHDGSLKTLEEVIDFYDQGGQRNRFLDKKIFPLHLTTGEKADLVTFLQVLTSHTLDFEKP